MDKKDFLKTLKDDPRRLRSFLHDPVTTLKAHGIDPTTVDTSPIPQELPESLQIANVGTGTSFSIAAAASAGV
jgi:hypothetical protein